MGKKRVPAVEFVPRTFCILADMLTNSLHSQWCSTGNKNDHKFNALILLDVWPCVQTFLLAIHIVQIMKLQIREIANLFTENMSFQTSQS